MVNVSGLTCTDAPGLALGILLGLYRRSEGAKNAQEGLNHHNEKSVGSGFGFLPRCAV